MLDQWNIQNYLDKFINLFSDDRLIDSKTEEEHEEHLRIELQILKQNQLYAKLSKCSLYQRQIQYLGHIIFREGIIVDSKKIEVIR